MGKSQYTLSNGWDCADFLSDIMYGYRNDLKRPAPIGQYQQDYPILCDIANKIEGITNPYKAARVAVRLSEKYLKSGQLHPEMSVIDTSSFSDEVAGHHDIRGLERVVVNAIERAPNTTVPCCTPACNEPAIKKSHAIQRNKILSSIVNESNTVLQMKLHPDEDSDFVQKVGWKDASTFPGFCMSCESKQFSSAETKNAPVNRNTIGKLLWRAMCFTRYRRAVEIQKRAEIVSKPKAYAIADTLSEPLVPLNSALIMKTRISAFRALDIWITAFEKGHYGLAERFGYLLLELESAPFVGAGAIPIHYDLNRNLISSPRRFISANSYMSFTSLCSAGKQYVVFGYDKTHKTAARVVNQLAEQSPHLISAFLPQLVIANSDTVYMSPTWWELEADELDQHIVKHSFFMHFAQMVFPWWGPIKNVNVLNTFRL